MKKYILTAFALAAVLLSGCNKELPAPHENEGQQNLVTFSGAIDPLTRTSLSGNLGGDLAFNWGVNDFILVSDGTTVKKSNPLSPSQAGSNSADFLVDTEGLKGSYSSWTVYYPGQKGVFEGADVSATISAKQIQDKVNDSGHLGLSGDCGYCKSSDITKDSSTGNYRFTITHAPAYLCFLPYVDADLSRAALDGEKIRLTQVSISSSNAVAGAYKLTTGGLAPATECEKADTTLLSSGFFLSHSLEEAKQKGGVFMAIAPQASSDIEVEYEFDYFDIPGTELTLKNRVFRRYKGLTFEAGKVYYIACHIRLDEVRVVDLGDGGCWAPANAGATSPVDYGRYFNYGATEPVNYTDSLSRVMWNETSVRWGYWRDGLVTNIDSSPALQAKHDPIYADEVHWGHVRGWRMPTEAELKKLPHRRTITYTNADNQSVWAGIFTGSNGNSILLPCAGWVANASKNEFGGNAHYMSSSTNGENSYRRLFFRNSYNDQYFADGSRGDAEPIRPYFDAPVGWNSTWVDLSDLTVEDPSSDSTIW